MSASRTTLAAVNQMLTRLGVAKVTALGASRASVQAQDLLNEVATDLQSEAWYFNVEKDLYIQPSDMGYVELTSDILSADLEDGYTKTTVRDGHLYNLTDNTPFWTPPSNTITKPTYIVSPDWTDDFDTNTIEPSFATGPRTSSGSREGRPLADTFPPNWLTYLADTNVGAARTAETADLVGLSSTNRYRISGYFRNGYQGGSAKAALRVQHDPGGGFATTAALLFNLTPDTPILRAEGSTSEGNGLLGDMENGQLHVLDVPGDAITAGYSGSTATNDPWVFISGEWTASSNEDGDDVRVQLIAHEDTAHASTADLFLKGIQVVPVGGNQGIGPLTVSRKLGFQALPLAAQQVVQAEALVFLHDSVLGTSSIRQELIRQAEKARERLLREQSDQADPNVIHDNFSAARFSSRHLNPLIRNGAGAQGRYLQNSPFRIR